MIKNTNYYFDGCLSHRVIMKLSRPVADVWAKLDRDNVKDNQQAIDLVIQNFDSAGDKHASGVLSAIITDLGHDHVSAFLAKYIRLVR
jgi:hypothetical protein